MENKWIKQGGNYKIVPSSITVEDQIPVAVYSIDMNPISGEFSLNYVADKFEFGFEVLGLETKFIDHALKSYENTSGNFGILLNGVKGTGKSCTAKILANKLQKPIILVDTAYKGIDSFLASLNFECILFFDEFEKNFDPKQDINILTIMDGVYNCCARKVFILTTNSLRINDCLLSRPSRIRYKKEFTNISLDVINYLLDKFLKDQSIREELFTYVTNLEVCSVDIIKALITELNIHGKEEFEYIKDIFNVKSSEAFYTCIAARDTYFNYETSSYVSRSINDIMQVLKLRNELGSKPILTEAERKTLGDLNETEVWQDSYTFPCRIWDLKKGMILKGEEIVDILLDQRIIVTVSTSGQKTYYYVKPTYNYNSYTGNILI